MFAAAAACATAFRVLPHRQVAPRLPFVLRSARVGADGTATEDTFSYAGGVMSFGSRLSIDRFVPSAKQELAAAYLTEPKRVLRAVWDADKIHVIDEAAGLFDLTLKPLQFVTLRFQPRVRVKIWFDDDEASINMLSQDFSLRGLESLDRGFLSTIGVDVEGKLAALSAGEDGKGLRLKGNVAFTTSGKIPLVLRLTPERVLRVAGSAICAQILEYVKDKFLGPLITDIRRFRA